MTLQLVLETIDTSPLTKTSFSSDKNAAISFVPTVDMVVRVTWNVTARASGGGYVFGVNTTYSGATQVPGSENIGACNLYIPGSWEGGHMLFRPDDGFFQLTAGVSATFAFGSASSGCVVDDHDRSSIVMQQIA